jgi:MATE family multidrug resistance protein
MPMWLAGASYWLVGFPTCLALGVGLGWKGVGVWLGLAFALMTAAILLSWRFISLSRTRV